MRQWFSRFSAKMYRFFYGKRSHANHPLVLKFPSPKIARSSARNITTIDITRIRGPEIKFGLRSPTEPPGTKIINRVSDRPELATRPAAYPPGGL
jgi:hypothetical protein